MLRSLKTDKASGPDGIPPRFLKEFADEWVPVLCCLFCLILISCTYPSSWKQALVQPVPKKIDHSIPPTIALLLSLWLLLRFLKHCLCLTSSNILNSVLFQITSIASVRQHLRGIFSTILLIPGHRLLGPSEYHSLSPLISLKDLRESGIRLC